MKLLINLITCRRPIGNPLSRVKSFGVAVIACSALLVSSSTLASDDHIPPALQDVSNIHKPNDRHYSAGQPDEAEFQTFAEHGVQHVVDLRPPEESKDINAPAWVSAAGMAYYHIPIAGADDLTREHVAVLDTILQRIGNEQAVLHCASSNRVGAMMALHGVWYKDMSEDEAIELGKDYGLTSLQDHVREALRTQ